MRHLDLEILQAVIEGDLPPKTLLRLLLQHVGELCPECGEVVAALQRGQQNGDRPVETPVASERWVAADGAQAAATLPDPRLVSVVDREESRAIDWSKRVRRERRRAHAELRELVRLPREHRAQRVERARSRFRSRTLAELLIEESRRVVRDDPVESGSLASLVDVVLLWTPGAVDQDWARELSLRAAGWRANALRVSGRLRPADQAFAELRVRLAREVAGSEALHAEICSLEASLRMDQRRFEEARNLLDRAAFLCRQADEQSLLARVLIQRAIVEGRQGDYEAAVRIQLEAFSLFDAEQDASLLESSVLNLGLYLIELDRHPEVRELLGRHRESLVAAGRWEWSRMQILRGRLALAEGRSDEAEELFVGAQAELTRRHDPARAAVVSLDLALLYLTSGRTAELRRLAQTMATIFEVEELHEEAMATAVLFQQAVAAESLTVEAIRGWRRRLESAGKPRPKQPS